MDEFSDLDLVLAVEPAHVQEVMLERQEIAASLGRLLVSFTGEHVGEPRLIIGLYADPLLHVDLKFVSLEDAARRVDEPVVLWERDGRLSQLLKREKGLFPSPNEQWIEDRFWIWMHAGASRVARGELFDAIEFLSFIRVNVLGPLGLQRAGRKPMGTRRVETHVPTLAADMTGTLATYDTEACFAAFERCARIYRQLRSADVIRRSDAEEAAMAYLAARGKVV
ncbi:MAG: oxalate:formate antiporter [Gammaproteobacteria bacterium]